MGLKDFAKSVTDEIKTLFGDKPKNKEYSNMKEFPDDLSASNAFEDSKRKLFNVNSWSSMEGINSKFTLFDDSGNPAGGKPQPGYFIKIELPGPPVENWVQVYEIQNEPDMAEFSVHPSKTPSEKTDPNAEVKHFFAKEASSTFRVTRTRNSIRAFEIGRNEYINNQGDESGNRKILNTLIAEGGWAGFQEIQWDKLTKYLVHSEDVETK